MRLVLIMSLASLAGLTQAAEVYRSIDSNGNVVYSDRPGPNAVAVVIHTPTPRAVTPLAAPAPAPSPAAAAGEDPASAEDAQAAAARAAEDRIANCQIARERSERYETSHRLYRVGDDGERAYLNDAQIDEARANARAEIARWCDQP